MFIRIPGWGSDNSVDSEGSDIGDEGIHIAPGQT